MQALKLLQGRCVGDLLGFEQGPLHAAGPLGAALDHMGARWREYRVNENVGLRGLQLVLDELHVMYDGVDRRVVIYEAKIREHAPFQVEEAVPLAEPDTVDGNGRRTCH